MRTRSDNIYLASELQAAKIVKAKAAMPGAMQIHSVTPATDSIKAYVRHAKQWWQSGTKPLQGSCSQCNATLAEWRRGGRCDKGWWLRYIWWRCADEKSSVDWEQTLSLMWWSLPEIMEGYSILPFGDRHVKLEGNVCSMHVYSI